MSTPVSTDLILVEAASTTGGRVSGQVYKETKANYDTATGGGGGGGGGGGSSSNGIVIKVYWCMNTTGYHASGRHRYGSGGSMAWLRSDGSGCYTRSSAASSLISSQRPNTKVKVDGTWYTLENGSSIGGSTSVGPMNMYYKRSVVSWCFTSAEMDTATGATSGSIQGISLQSYSSPSGSYNMFPNFGISLMTHNVANTTTNYSSNTFTHNNYSNSNYAYSTTTDAWNDFTFSTAVSWS